MTTASWADATASVALLAAAITAASVLTPSVSVADVRASRNQVRSLWARVLRRVNITGSGAMHLPSLPTTTHSNTSVAVSMPLLSSTAVHVTTSNAHVSATASTPANEELLQGNSASASGGVISSALPSARARALPHSGVLLADAPGRFSAIVPLAAAAAGVDSTTTTATAKVYGADTGIYSGFDSESLAAGTQAALTLFLLGVSAPLSSASTLASATVPFTDPSTPSKEVTSDAIIARIASEAAAAEAKAVAACTVAETAASAFTLAPILPQLLANAPDVAALALSVLTAAKNSDNNDEANNESGPSVAAATASAARCVAWCASVLLPALVAAQAQSALTSVAHAIALDAHRWCLAVSGPSTADSTVSSVWHADRELVRRAAALHPYLAPVTHSVLNVCYAASLAAGVTVLGAVTTDIPQALPTQSDWGASVLPALRGLALRVLRSATVVFSVAGGADARETLGRAKGGARGAVASTKSTSSNSAKDLDETLLQELVPALLTDLSQAQSTEPTLLDGGLALLSTVLDSPANLTTLLITVKMNDDRNNTSSSDRAFMRSDAVKRALSQAARHLLFIHNQYSSKNINATETETVSPAIVSETSMARLFMLSSQLSRAECALMERVLLQKPFVAGSAAAARLAAAAAATGASQETAAVVAEVLHFVEN